MTLDRLLPYVTILVYAAVAIFGAFSGGMWAGTGIGLSLCLYFGTSYRDRCWPRPSKNFLILALIALDIFALLNFRSANSAVSWFDWLRLVTIFLPLLLLSSPEILKHAAHPRLFQILVFAVFAGSFALGVELVLGAPVMHVAEGVKPILSKFNRGFSYLVILAMPVLAYIATSRESWRHKAVLWALCVISLLFPASFSESRAAKLALMIALLVIVAAYLSPNLVYRGLHTLVFMLLLWPLAVQSAFMHFYPMISRLPDSWLARMEIWDFMSYRIFERPWLGWGLGTSKQLDFVKPHGNFYVFTIVPAPHPHNVVTQLWVECGVPGLVFGILFALIVLRRIRRMPPDIVPYGYGAWIAALCLSLVAYNFWTDSLWAAFALTGFAFALLEFQNAKTALPALKYQTAVSIDIAG